MKKTTILQKESPRLREIAKEVPLKDITSPHVQDIIAQMKAAVKAEDDGVAIAAPQIGKSVRIFVVAGRTMNLLKKRPGRTQEVDGEEEVIYPDMIFINPILTKLSKKKRKMEEGCLSVRWLYGVVERSEKATVVAYDERGKKFEKGASGLMAQIFQHEVDHLNGILFIDKAENVENIPPEKQSQDHDAT